MNNTLEDLQRLSQQTLSKVVTDDGIYASTALGDEGLFHGFFGRDTAITAYLVAHTEHLKQDSFFLMNAVKGLTQLMNWQGVKEDSNTGEETGKFPHEVRLNEEDYIHLTEGKIKQGYKPWYVDPNDRVLKNWDTNDATQLWIIVIARMHEKNMLPLSKEIRTALKRALLWCVKNQREHEGFTGYRFNPDRTWGGVTNMNWKDSMGAYLLDDGTRAPHPIKDVFGSALTWASLKYGSKLFASYDRIFSLFLQNEADRLKQRFNSENGGFLMKDHKSDYYYAEAIDAYGRQMTAVTCDPGLALWAYCDGESIIDNKYLKDVVKRLFEDDMFDPDAGVRTYSCEGNIFDPIGYHRGPHVFWPFVSGLMADGLTHFGYKYEAKQLLKAMIRGVKRFDACVELFVKKDNEYTRFKHPYRNQVSCTDQAWTAAAVYYGTTFLQQEQEMI